MEQEFMDTIVDTQIISYLFKGSDLFSSTENLSITSTTANEFLLAQTGDNEHPNYYVLLPSRYTQLISPDESGVYPFSEHFRNPKWARLGSRRTDRLIIDFGNQFPPYQEYGNYAISEVINKRLARLYDLCIAHLPKDDQKYLRKRLHFLLDHNYSCYPLNKNAVDRGLELFSQFVSSHNCKENIRNTVNDVLILASAIEYQKPFLTKDNLLSRFAADTYNVQAIKQEDNILVDFSKIEPGHRRKSLESKGYINRGWSYAIRNRKTVP